MPYPDYNNSLINLMGRIAFNFNASTQGYAALEHRMFNSMQDRQNIILLVVDGMGYQYLDEQQGLLKNHIQAQLTSVFPSTTASSISTFLTGQAPQQHGLTGWFVYLEEIDEVTAVLPFNTRGSGLSLKDREIDPCELYQHTPFFDLLDVQSYVVSPDWIINSEFNRCHCGKAISVPYTDLAGMCASISQLASQREKKYIYAYWPDFDRLSHKFGNHSEQVAQHFIELQIAIEQLCFELQGTNSLLLITADHGFIDTTPDRMINVNKHPLMQECLRLPLCGEPRLAYCYLYQDKITQFLEYVNQEFQDELECIESKLLVEQGVYGKGKPHPQLLQRVGDYVLVMKDNHVVKDWLPSEKPFFHLGVHGGTSESEIYVPLIAIEP